MGDWGEVGVAGAEVGVLGLMKLTSKWFPAFARIQWAGRLALPAAGAGAVWLLAKPWGDDEIERAWNTWRTASQQLMDLRINDWNGHVQAIQKAWPDGADRAAFDAFMKDVWDEMFQTEQAFAKIADGVQGAQTQIHQIMHTVGIVADLLLATLIALEVAEAAFPPDSVIVEALKSATGAVLMGVTAAGVGSVAVALLYNLGNFSALASSDTAFPHPQPNRGIAGVEGKTDFKDLTVSNTQHHGWTYY